MSESGDEFRAATGLTVESSNNLMRFLNPGKDSCNITFYDTSGRLSQNFLWPMILVALSLELTDIVYTIGSF